MKSDFLIAITQLSAEKNLPKEVVLKAVEAALVSAYKKDNFASNQNISVKIDSATGKVTVWAEKAVVELPSDVRREVSLDEAHKVKSDAQIGDIIEVEATPHNAGRIAAQTAKQVILQRLHEAEHSAIFEEYIDKEGEIVTGLVQRIEPKQIFIDLGRTEAILPAAEQVRTERYRIGQRLKVYLLEVAQTNRGPRVIVSRSHPNLLRRLFELEIPEIFNGIVEIKAVAREASNRSKIAVAARQDGIDPVGCCVGLRGIRIQNIVTELGGEKLDVVKWDPDTSVFITNALSPAQVLGVELDEENGVATAVVPDRQLSLAIGKEGQNVRLAAKLTGWRIDIKSASAVEEERLAEAKLVIEAEEEAVIGEELTTETPATLEPALVSTEVPPDEAAEPLADLDTTPVPQEVSLPQQTTEGKRELRFAEDILVSGPPKPEARSRKKKKKVARSQEKNADGIKATKPRRARKVVEEDSEEY
jgi:N utilization substance protein A